MTDCCNTCKEIRSWPQADGKGFVVVFVEGNTFSLGILAKFQPQQLHCLNIPIYSND